MPLGRHGEELHLSQIAGPSVVPLPVPTPAFYEQQLDPHTLAVDIQGLQQYV